MGAWTESLPPVMSHKDQRINGEKALRNIVLALEQDRAGDAAMMLSYVQFAAASVRQWRKSLPKDQQSTRIDIGQAWERSNRDVLQRAIIATTRADMDPHDPARWLRSAEAHLRTLGRRLMGEK